MFSPVFLREYARQRQAEILEAAEQDHLARLASPVSGSWLDRVADMLLAAGNRLKRHGAGDLTAPTTQWLATTAIRDGDEFAALLPPPLEALEPCTCGTPTAPFSTRRS
jgi:hypothetical protein